eukprot:Gregarina_sp_Poly_1__6475@NODE_3466_length_1077_cov_45_352475_g2199_i0_p1_GENE_NODE_3466_length_1077_cov_45_352475_g2199_i0NODE_3466_length_1077_cov_45_352475_g2199_i0_p1_ORF_typecomplete_len212_score10_56_NODE_3466_length_1077_cov_45_352475_g2199_i0232867
MRRGCGFRTESSRQNGNLPDILKSCSQILAVNEQLAIECHSDLLELPGLGICQHLKDYKMAFSVGFSEWRFNKFVRIICRKDCEQARIDTIEAGKAEWEGCDLWSMMHNVRDRDLKTVMEDMKLKFVKPKLNERSNKTCFDFFHCWVYFLTDANIRSTIFQFLGHTAEYYQNARITQPEIFLDYQMLLLRRREKQKRKNRGCLKSCSGENY